MKRLEAIARMVERIYDAAADDAAAIGAMVMRLGADGEVPFSFDDYPQAKARMDELLSWLRSQLEVVVAEGVAGEWQLSEDKNDELVRRVLGLPDDADPGDMPEPLRRRWLDRNEKGREAFLKRKERGLGLSERVWRGTQSFPSEIAMGIDMGILDGKPAASMARDLKQYLKHPDKLFRRVRDERGILHLSKNAAAFHPGQGVYRSSYQNARRLAVTETNMAYHTADHERWQQLDFVVGIEVHLSGNHTCKGRDGKPHKFEDICDQLKGKYPKDFKFTGWHPHCRCYATSILKTEEELDEDMRKTMAGEPVDGESVNKVEEPPKGFEDWVEKNEGRIAEAKRKGTLAGWVKDNEGYAGVKSEAISEVSNNSMAALLEPVKSRVNTLHDGMKDRLFHEKDVLAFLNERLLDEPVNGVLEGFDVDRENYARAIMRTVTRKMEDGSYRHRILISNTSVPVIGKDGKMTTFNPMRELQGALEAIKTNTPLTFNQEYAIEGIWHELRHAKGKNWKDFDVRRHPDNQVIAMETINQFCARRMYTGFLKRLGIEAIHQEEILLHGYSYKIELVNFKLILEKYKISEESVFSHFSNRIIVNDYEMIFDNVVKFLKKRKVKNAESLIERLRWKNESFNKFMDGI